MQWKDDPKCDSLACEQLGNAQDEAGVLESSSRHQQVKQDSMERNSVKERKNENKKQYILMVLFR